MDADTGGTAGHLMVSVRPWAGGLVIRPEGELDHESAGPLREALDAALDAPPARLVVDCGGLDFCDSTGLNLLLRAHATARAGGGALSLAAPGEMVSRMLTITGVGEVFPVYPTLDEALAGQVGG
ncbi:STAS domain-containing protein [Kitasatospora sp. NPDC094015]|uniref:STAS domain-containing protein n=1 Tax=Kitasatospora sp. NPDC094015 TaxID=3155205 RepID=UPI00332E5A12